ncbi:MAG: bifunctional adenosylcobinamide kinase/adenosylcobinamide-phosphate guanylyltransferase [Acidimicrobiales bacterium]
MITLVLGGAASGKSSVAEALAAGLSAPVTYVATATVDAHDLDLCARIAAHQARRPSSWATVEATAPSTLVPSLRACRGTALVDALGTWVASAPELAVDPESLTRALLERDGDSIVVSDEVGMGVHPSAAVGRRFRDVLGNVNQEVAAVADEVLLVVAGRVLPLGPLRSR